MCDALETNERDDLKKGKLIYSVKCIREEKQENRKVHFIKKYRIISDL